MNNSNPESDYVKFDLNSDDVFFIFLNLGNVIPKEYPQIEEC